MVLDHELGVRKLEIEEAKLMVTLHEGHQDREANKAQDEANMATTEKDAPEAPDPEDTAKLVAKHLEPIIAKHMSAPKRIIRGPDGRVAGVETVQS